MFDSSAIAQQAEAAMLRFTFTTLAIEAVMAALFFWVLYGVLKAAIRDGINESKLGEIWRREVGRTKGQEKGEALPPMRAD